MDREPTKEDRTRPLSPTDSLNILELAVPPVYDNHPVLTSMELRLQDLRDCYRSQPNEHTRYQLVRHEQLIAQWAPFRFQAS